MSYPFPQRQPAPVLPTPRGEDVVRGLIFAIPAIIGGAALSALIWKLGFMASMSSYLLAAGAVFLYAKGSGGQIMRGIAPLILLIIVGVVVAFFACVAVDLNTVYSKYAAVAPVSRSSFILDNLFRGEVLKNYGKEIGFFALFAGLGIFSTLRRLVQAR